MATKQTPEQEQELQTLADLRAINTPVQEALLRGSGAGSLADWARQTFQTGEAFNLDVAAATDTGAGFVQDAFRWRRAQGSIAPPPILSAQLYSVINAYHPDVSMVDPADFWRFPAGSTVNFTGTGNAILDDPNAVFNVISSDPGMGTFKIDADLSSAPAVILQGTINLLTQPTHVAPHGAPLSIEQSTLLANAGAGALSDYARQAYAAGGQITLTRDELAAHGAGSAQDMFRTPSATQAPPPVDPPVELPPPETELPPPETETPASHHGKHGKKR